MSSSFRLPRLYPIVDVREETAEAAERALGLAVDLAAAGAALLQLRAKPLTAGVLTALATRMVAAVASHGTRVIVNDRADVALAAGAAGVHVGDEDLPVAAVREVLGPGKIVGYSTHSIEDVVAAARLPVDYLGFGPVYDSPTKAGVRQPRGVDLLAVACQASVLPVVAIGGITFARAPDCWSAGAASVAVISEIEQSSDVGALVSKYLRASTAKLPSTAAH